MKTHFLLFLLLAIVSYSYSQEDCANGIDDDGDGLVDLNDSECDCAGFVDIGTGILLNPSFEDMSCCPTSVAMLSCADDWVSASSATTDYFHTCGITEKPGMTPPLFPLPGGGSGYAGFYEQGSIEWQEYVGQCLGSTLLGGTSYTLNFWMAWGDEGNDIDIAIFGTPTCTDLPWSGNMCPTSTGGSWELLASTPVLVPTDGSWVQVTMSFIPSVDISAIVIGSDCEPLPSIWDFFYVDEMMLIETGTYPGVIISETGSWCAVRI